MIAREGFLRIAERCKQGIVPRLCRDSTRRVVAALRDCQGSWCWKAAVIHPALREGPPGPALHSSRQPPQLDACSRQDSTWTVHEQGRNCLGPARASEAGTPARGHGVWCQPSSPLVMQSQRGNRVFPPCLRRSWRGRRGYPSFSGLTPGASFLQPWRACNRPRAVRHIMAVRSGALEGRE